MSDSLRLSSAKWISAVFNPLWVGVLFFVFLVSVNDYSKKDTILILLSGTLSTVVLPVLIVGIMVKTGKAENMDVPDRRKRLLPFVLFAAEYSVFAVLNYLLRLPIEFQAVMWIVLVNTVIYGIITVWWKVSIHAAGIAGYIVCILWFLNSFCLAAFLPLLAVDWSRVVLKAHTVAQVTVGSILGIGLTWLQLSIYLM